MRATFGIHTEEAFDLEVPFLITRPILRNMRALVSKGVAESEDKALSTAEVVRTQGAFVWRVLRHLGVREQDLDDGCQEVFLIVHRKLDDFQGRSQLTTWLYSICIRFVMHYRRTLARRKEHPSELQDQRAIEGGQNWAIQSRDAQKLGQRLLERLDDNQRQVFVLYELERQPMSEVASALGIPLQTGYARLKSARRAVIEAYRELEKEGSE